MLTQAAAAWLLGCVFVRFIEDNGLVEEALISGPGERRNHAAERQILYFRNTLSTAIAITCTQPFVSSQS